MTHLDLMWPAGIELNTTLSKELARWFSPFEIFCSQFRNVGQVYILVLHTFKAIPVSL